MSIKDYVRERDTRTACFITETIYLKDISEFINSCGFYMQGKDIQKIRINLSFDFLENPYDEELEEKKKLNQ